MHARKTKERRRNSVGLEYLKTLSGHRFARLQIFLNDVCICAINPQHTAPAMSARSLVKLSWNMGWW